MFRYTQKNSIKSFINERARNGFTLIEIIVSLGVFALIILIVIGIFINITRQSRQSIDTQSVYNDIRLTMELLAREFRTGKNFEIINKGYDNDCPNTSQTQDQNNYCLRLENQAGQTITFWVDDGKLFRRQNDTNNQNNNTYTEQITSNKSNTEIVRLDAILSKTENEQERITLILKAKPAGSKETQDTTILLQTSISSRNYNKQLIQ